MKRTTLGPAIKASSPSSPAHVVMSFALPAYSALVHSQSINLDHEFHQILDIQHLKYLRHQGNIDDGVLRLQVLLVY